MEQKVKMQKKKNSDCVCAHALYLWRWFLIKVLRLRYWLILLLFHMRAVLITDHLHVYRQTNQRERDRHVWTNSCTASVWPHSGAWVQLNRVWMDRMRSVGRLCASMRVCEGVCPTFVLCISFWFLVISVTLHNSGFYSYTHAFKHTHTHNMIHTDTHCSDLFRPRVRCELYPLSTQTYTH